MFVLQEIFTISTKLTKEQRYEVSLLCFNLLQKGADNVQEKEAIINELNKSLGYGYLHQVTLVYNAIVREMEKLK